MFRTKWHNTVDPKVFNTWRADNSMTCAFAAFFQWDNLKESPGFDPLLLQVELPSSLGSSAQLGACLQELQERLNTRIYQMTTRNTDKSLQNQVPGEELVVLGVDKRRATCLRGDNTFQGFSGCVIFSIQNIQKFFFKSLAFPSPKTACLKHHDAMESDDFGSCSETAHISVILILLLLLLLSSMIIVIFIYMLIKIEIWPYYVNMIYIVAWVSTSPLWTSSYYHSMRQTKTVISSPFFLRRRTNRGQIKDQHAPKEKKGLPVHHLICFP